MKESLEEYTKRRLSEDNIDSRCRTQLKIDEHPDARSNRQIMYLIDAVRRYDLADEHNALLQMFMQFIGLEDALTLFRSIRKRRMGDKQIIFALKSMSRHRKRRRQRNYSRECDGRIFMFNQIKGYLETSGVNTSLPYLDVGCGDGVKTVQFADSIGVDRSRVHGADVVDWGPYTKEKRDAIKFTFREIKNGNYDYKDSSFGIVSLLTVFHHIEDTDNALSEIHRVLKKDGHLVVIDHDVVDELDKVMLDIQHAVFGMITDNNPAYVDNPEYSVYRNRYELEYMITRAGFKLVHTQRCYRSIKMIPKYDRQILLVFQKV